MAFSPLPPLPSILNFCYRTSLFNSCYEFLELLLPVSWTSATLELLQCRDYELLELFLFFFKKAHYVHGGPIQGPMVLLELLLSVS